MCTDVQREQKRIDMARRRADPALRLAVLETQRRSYEKIGRERQRERTQRKKAAFFPWRIQFARRHNPALTVEDIEGLWNAQQGRCALTGRRLDDQAQLDHIIPQSRGGSGEIANLRWVCPEVNRAKREMLDDEFFALCGEVIEYVGRRIMAEAR